MLTDDKINLSKRRLERANECLSAAQALLDAGSIESVPNRSYYAVFHAMRAVLALDGIDMKHHSGIISNFRKMYIKAGVFDKGISDIISVLLDSRTDGDYDDFYVISKEDAAENLKSAEYFVNVITGYLEGSYFEN